MAKFNLDDFYDDAFHLIAIHTKAEDYTLAFALNKHLGIQLQKRRTDLDLSQNKKDTSYPIFDFEREDTTIFYLVGNRCVIDDKNQLFPVGLFDNTRQTTLYLLPELKTVDYFLKVEPELILNELTTTLKKLKEVQFIQTAYIVNHETLKSTSHLNFDEWIPQKELK